VLIDVGGVFCFNFFHIKSGCLWEFVAFFDRRFSFDFKLVCEFFQMPLTNEISLTEKVGLTSEESSTVGAA